MKARFLIPLIIFIGLVAVFGIGLTLDPREVPSPLINKPAPEFALPALSDPAKQVRKKDLQGGVTLFNVWASWCVSCREEHPFLVKLSREHVVPIYGLNYKDTREAAHQWLNRLGNPYVDSAFDEKGRVGIDWGVYGVPETFLVDRSGMIRYKQIGPITPEVWEKTILPKIKALQSEGQG